jgi:prepilin-type processing-associated H-X9-DG protein
MSKLNFFVIAALLAAGVAALLMMQHQSQAQLRSENESLRQQVKQMDELSAENERLSKALAGSTNSLAKDQMQELLRLRGQVGVLRGQTNQLAKLREENLRLQAMQAKPATTAAQTEADPAAEQMKQVAIAKMGDARQLVLSLHLYAGDHQDHLPANLDLTNLQSYTAGAPPGGTNRFDLVYQGTLHDFANPGAIIVIREQNPWPGLDGKPARTYGFADGHVEVHVAPDGNFDVWEKEHMVAPPP